MRLGRTQSSSPIPESVRGALLSRALAAALPPLPLALPPRHEAVSQLSRVIEFKLGLGLGLAIGSVGGRGFGGGRAVGFGF
jgi:hypothetical protein